MCNSFHPVAFLASYQDHVVDAEPPLPAGGAKKEELQYTSCPLLGGFYGITEKNSTESSIKLEIILRKKTRLLMLRRKVVSVEQLSASRPSLYTAAFCLYKSLHI